MSKNLNDYKREISALVKKNDYVSLTQLFDDQQLGFEFYCFFLVQKQNGNKDLQLDLNFWKSDFSRCFVSEIISSHFAYSFYKSFFYRESHFSPEILDAAQKANVSKLVQLLKIHEGFDSSACMDYLSKAEEETLRALFLEFQIIGQLKRRCEVELISQINELAANYNTKDVLLQVSILHSHNSNNSGITVEFIRFLNLYLSNIVNVNSSCEIGPDGPYRIEEITIHVLDILRERQLVEYYKFGFIDFSCIEKKRAIIKSNGKFVKYKIDDAKVLLFERYFLFNKDMRKFLVDREKSKVSVRNDFFNLHGNLQDLFKNEFGFTVNEAIKILEGIAGHTHFVSSKENVFWKGVKRENNRIFTIDKIKDYLITDLNDKEKKSNVNIIERPFLRIGNEFVVMPLFLQSRRWAVIFMNRLIDDLPKNVVGNDFEKAVNKCLSGTELVLVDIPKEVETASGEKTDIDAIYYHPQTKTLLVGQVKCSKIVEDEDFLLYAINKRLEGDARHQMDISLQWIKENWDEKIAVKNSIHVAYSQLSIRPLIITNYFDGDGIMYGNKYPKMSLLQLDAIISGDISALDLSPLGNYISKCARNCTESKKTRSVDLLLHVLEQPHKIEQMWNVANFHVSDLNFVLNTN